MMSEGRMDITKGTSASPAAGEERRVSKLAVFLIVVALIAASFGSGALVVFLKFRGAEQAWKQERAGLESDLAARTAELSAAKSRELLWELNDGMATVYADLSANNFGLAQDRLTALTTAMANGSAGLDADTKARLAPLEPLLADIARGAQSLSPDAKRKAQEARTLLQGLLHPQ